MIGVVPCHIGNIHRNILYTDAQLRQNTLEGRRWAEHWCGPLSLTTVASSPQQIRSPNVDEDDDDEDDDDDDDDDDEEEEEEEGEEEMMNKMIR